MGDMPIGPCCVCGEELDHTEAGFCDTCGRPFCWGSCGGWQDGSHCCNNDRDDEPTTGDYHDNDD